MQKKPKKVVILGGGVGASTFTKALKDLPVELTTIVSSFDDGGSTGSLRISYPSFALGDFRNCIINSLDLDEKLVNILNYRFGKGNLFGANVGNLLIRSFLFQYKNDREAVEELHKFLKLKNKVIPISYTFAKLCAELENKKILKNQNEIAKYLDFSKSPIKNIFLDRKVVLNPEAKKAILSADYVLFAPGNFFTSLLPHIFVDGFGSIWKKSKAKKIWFANIMAHKGQDNSFSLIDYIKWFERKLGHRPFDQIVLNKKISSEIMKKVQKRFSPFKFNKKDLDILKKDNVETFFAELIFSKIRKQNPNDTVLRAPVKHDYKKVGNFVRKIFAL